MRLLNIETLKFGEFYDENIPDYWILSHRWCEKEVSYEEFLKPEDTDGPGYCKIVDFCNFVGDFSTQVKNDAPDELHSRWEPRTSSFLNLIADVDRPFVEWIWIDTCYSVLIGDFENSGIDKRSSAELSEAVNSMYRWYSNAKACIVYLSDVDSGEDPSISRSSFGNSTWFQRGWTLQELLAPDLLIFCNTDWGVFGHICKDTSIDSWPTPPCDHYEFHYGPDLSSDVSRITNIPLDYVQNNRKRDTFSIAQKMSWASRRKTSRLEDEAYCLLGIFGVNMPLIYGEGPKAFFRLQQEIIKEWPDESIFAWMSKDLTAQAPQKYREKYQSLLRNFTPSLLFAPSPAAFASSGTVETERRLKRSLLAKPVPYALTNFGLEMRVKLFPVRIAELPTTDTYFVYLRCSLGEGVKTSERGVLISAHYRMALVRLKASYGDNRFARLHMGDVSRVAALSDEGTEELVYIDTGRHRGPLRNSFWKACAVRTTPVKENSSRARA